VRFYVDGSQNTGESADVLKKWASLSKPATFSWRPLEGMVRVAEAEAQQLESQLDQLVKESNARLEAISLCDPLCARAGLNRWLAKEREEAYSDWFAWILEQLQSPQGGSEKILKVLGITEPEIVAGSQSRTFKIEREYSIPYGRLDLLLTIDKFVMIIIEVKKYSAETSDTAKQAGYFEWLESKTTFPERKAFLLTTDAGEEKYENFSTMRWADVCIRLRRLLPELSAGIGPVRTAMFVAFVSAVETNLLNFVAPPQKEAVERLFYARTIDHLEKYLGENAV